MNNILVIEDQDADAAIIKAYLEEAAFKHKLFHSYTLKEGISILEENPIDLVLLDLSIKDSMGFNTLKKYLDESADTPVVVMTGNKNEIVGIQSVKAGAQDFLVKGDFDSRRLVNTIRYSLQRFKTQAKLQETADKLSITEKRRIEAQNMAKFANWEMDIVSNAMSWSEEMFRIFGVQPNSFQPSLSDYLDFVHVEDRDKVEDFFAEVIKTGQLNRLEHRILINNRMLKFLTIQARVNYDELTNKIILIGSIQDTSYRQSPEEVELPKEEVSTEVPTPLKGSELYRFGFSVRTPVSSIVNLIYLLEKSNPSHQQLELIEGLKTSVDDLSIVLNNMLNISLLISDNIALQEEEFSLREMMQNIQRVVDFKAFQLGIQINFTMEGAIPDIVKGDLQKLTQIIHNLTEQSFRRCNEGCQIGIHLHWFKRKKDYPFDLKITYNGEPIPTAERLRNESKPLTDNLQSLQEAMQENHLGLSIAYRLMEILGAKLETEVADDKSILRLLAPLEIVAQEDQSAMHKPNKPLNILMVEDHVINQIATRKVLTSWSDMVSVDIAADGEQALERFKQNHYDLILMDLQMPKMDGLEATLKIRAQSKVPIIALTANSSKQEEEKCLGIGMNAYLVKPFKPDELYAKIAKFL